MFPCFLSKSEVSSIFFERLFGCSFGVFQRCFTVYPLNVPFDLVDLKSSS